MCSLYCAVGELCTSKATNRHTVVRLINNCTTHAPYYYVSQFLIGLRTQKKTMCTGLCKLFLLSLPQWNNCSYIIIIIVVVIIVVVVVILLARILVNTTVKPNIVIQTKIFTSSAKTNFDTVSFMYTSNFTYVCQKL